MGAAFVFGAERLCDLNVRLESWGPAWQRRVRRGINQRFLRPRALVWSDRLVGAAWMACGVVLVLDWLAR